MGYYAGEPFWERHMGKLTTLVLASLFALVAWAIVAEGREKDATCARLMAMAETRQDSMAVIMRCELPDHRNTTTVVPVVVR